MSQTIAAISTGNQISAIGIIRLTGDNCGRIAGRVFKLNSRLPLHQAPDRKLMLGQLYDKEGRVIDSCCAIFSRGPHSYTGEDTVEFHCHGSPAVLAAGLEALYAAGARPAQRGEFTKRAFLNGKLDLTQAEAVIDLIEADSAEAAANAAGQVQGVLQRKLAPVYNDLTNLCSHFHAVLDYPDEDIDDFRLTQYAVPLKNNLNTLYVLLKSYERGRVLRTGVTAAIVGKPNVGKSSLLNALAGYDRVIVTEIAGTTRDTIEETVKLGSVKLRLIDTAGIHETSDRIEAIGVDRSRKAIEEADMVIFVCDGSKPLDDDDRTIMALCKDKSHAVALINKSDLPSQFGIRDLPFTDILKVSASTGAGLDRLTETVEDWFGGAVTCDGSLLTNARQFDAIRRAHDAIARSLQGLMMGLTPDAVLTDIEEAMYAMGEVTGATVREDITGRIFERFCVGK